MFQDETAKPIYPNDLNTTRMAIRGMINAVYRLHYDPPAV
jgi:hypothetical protein